MFTSKILSWRVKQEVDVRPFWICVTRYNWSRQSCIPNLKSFHQVEAEKSVTKNVYFKILSRLVKQEVDVRPDLKMCHTVQLIVSEAVYQVWNLSLQVEAE